MSTCAHGRVCPNRRYCDVLRQAAGGGLPIGSPGLRSGSLIPHHTPPVDFGYKKARFGHSVNLNRHRARAGDNIDESGKRATCFRIRGQHRDSAAGVHRAGVFGGGPAGMFGDNGDPSSCRYWVPTNADTGKAYYR